MMTVIRTCITAISFALLIMLLVALIGCTSEQLSAVDTVVADVNAVGQAASTMAEAVPGTPVGNVAGIVAATVGALSGTYWLLRRRLKAVNNHDDEGTQSGRGG